MDFDQVTVNGVNSNQRDWEPLNRDFPVFLFRVIMNYQVRVEQSLPFHTGNLLRWGG